MSDEVRKKLPTRTLIGNIIDEGVPFSTPSNDFNEPKLYE